MPPENERPGPEQPGLRRDDPGIPNPTPEDLKSLEMYACPNCGKMNPLTPHPTRPGVRIMICSCNDVGPTYEVTETRAQAHDRARRKPA